MRKPEPSRVWITLTGCEYAGMSVKFVSTDAISARGSLGNARGDSRNDDVRQEYWVNGVCVSRDVDWNGGACVQREDKNGRTL